MLKMLVGVFDLGKTKSLDPFSKEAEEDGYLSTAVALNNDHIVSVLPLGRKDAEGGVCTEYFKVRLVTGGTYYISRLAGDRDYLSSDNNPYVQLIEKLNGNNSEDKSWQ